MMVSIVTATYNRAHLLARLIDSLKKQTNCNFEWIIVDDGSSDKTESILKSELAGSGIQYRYFIQVNSGKHVALNRAFDEAEGDYLIILDSDDTLAENAVDKIINEFTLVECDNSIGVLSFCNQSFDKKPIGNCLFGFTASQLDYLYKYRGTGDRTEVFKKVVYKKFRFPVFKNELFCPEALIWNRIGLEYQTKYVSEVIYFCEYQSDGLTSKIVSIRIDAPQATLLYYRELFSYPIPCLDKLKACANYWRFLFHANHKLQHIKINNFSLYDVASLPLGAILFCKDKYLL